MTSPPLDNTHGRTTSGVTCHHRLWKAHTVERRAWHAIIAFGQHTQSNDIGRGMTSSLLDSTHGHMKSGVTCHHYLWTAHTVGLGRQHRAWHDITALGHYTRSYYVRLHRVWHDITAFGQHTRSDNVGRGMPSSPLGSTDGRTTSGVACHHSPWTANTVKRRQA